MKITIDLGKCEVKAITEYLKQFEDDGTKITKEQIKEEIVGIVSGNLQIGSLGDYYKQYCMNENKTV